MMTVIHHAAHDHNMWLVLLATLVCVGGAWWVFRLFARATVTTGLQRNAWLLLTTIAGGATMWCTHFIAMIGYQFHLPFKLNPLLAVLALAIAMAGAGAGFWVAGRRSPVAAFAGGAIVGLTIAAMHYTGMLAYHLYGTIAWDMNYLIASVLLSAAFAAAATRIAVVGTMPHQHTIAGALFALAIIAMHFTGMVAFRVEPAFNGIPAPNTQALVVLALGIASVGLTVVATGGASYMIDARTRADTFERIRRLAFNDSLTGLPNRASFHEHLGRELSRAHCDGAELAIVCIDLDRFKELNDVNGHAAGDTVLQTVGERMKSLLSEDNFVARLGGDEFAAVHRLRDEQSLSRFLENLWFALTGPVQLDSHSYLPGASIGVANYPRDAAAAEVLLNNADLALYRAKSGRMEKICFYEAAVDDAVRIRRALANDLREAIAGDLLEVHYQVQTSIITGETKGFEALLRWNHPTRGAISPAEFVPLAERKGLILQLGEWVLRRACTDARSWNNDYSVAVNCSPLQFAHADLPRLVMSILVETGLPPRRLELELTESAIFADRERALRQLHQIKALGVRIALDDFGTGYSSLDVLRSFPFDRIKLDASFVRELEKSPQAVAMVRAILALGKSLDIPVLAEGVETRGQLMLLQQQGCDETQGFLLGRPAGLAEVLKRMAHGVFASRNDSAGTALRNSDAA
ncbi:EAL domain-containing protein [Sphingomonas sp.]|nr:EAL domain-containing protein [Sphingomonas sp.]